MPVKLRIVFFVCVVLISSAMPLWAQETALLSARWNVQGDRIAVVDGQVVIIYDDSLAELKRITVFAPEEGVYLSGISVLWSPHGDKIAVYGSGDSFRGYRIWDVATGEKVGEIRVDTWSWLATWLPDNEHLAMRLGEEKTLFVYGMDGTQLDTWDFPIETLYYGTEDPDDTVIWNKDILDTAWTPDGRWLVTSTNYDIPIDIWDTDTKENVGTIQCFRCFNYLITLRLSPKGRSILFSAQDDSIIEVWSINPVNFVDNFTIPDDTYPYSSPLYFGWRDDSRVWAAANDGFLYVWRFKVQAPIGTFPIDIDHIQDVNADGTKALYGEGNILRVAHVETGETLAEVTIDSEAVFAERPWEPDPRG